MSTTKRKSITVIILYVFVLVVALVLLYRFGNRIDVPAIQRLVASFGPIAPVFFFFLSAATNVLPPFPVIPFWFTGIALFDEPFSYLLVYCSNLLGATVAYLIARYLGRLAVAKVAGQKSLTKIEKYTGLHSFWSLTILRAASGVASDYLSFAYGLTNIRFLPYFISTAIGLLPSVFIGIFFINRALLSPLSYAAGYLTLITFINYAFTLCSIPVFLFLQRREKHFKSS